MSDRLPAHRIAAACLLLATACHTPPEELPEAQPLELPDSWQSGQAGEDGAAVDAEDAPADSQPGGAQEAAWWLSFDAPGMHRAVEDTISHNPDLAAAAARVVAADARLRAIAGERSPQVSAGLSANRARNALIGLPFPGSDVLFQQDTRFEAGLSASWEIDLWGRLGAQTRAAEQELQATAADYVAAHLSLAGQAAKTWLQWQEARLQLELAEEAVALAEAQRDLVERRFQHGAATAEMLVEAESAVAAVIAAQLDVELGVQAAARALEVLAGRYPVSDVEADRAWLPKLPPPPPSGMPAELLDRRPDLHAAAARVEAAREQYGVARAALYPRLSLTAQAGTASNSLGDLLDGDFRVWSLGANLTQPIFGGARLRASADEAAATARAAEIGFAARMLEACAEVEAALDTEARVRDRIDDLQRAETQSHRALALAEERFARGVGDPVAVYGAREDARQSRQRLLSARRLLLVNRIDLHLALGGGFDAAPRP